MADEKAKELQWPPLLSQRGDGWVESLAGVTAICGALTAPATNTRWLWWTLVGIAATSGVLMVLITLARTERRNHERQQSAAEANQVHDRWLTVVRDRIGALLLQVGKVVNTDDPQLRRDLASSARVSILTLASADAIGMRGDGVRMNLFRLSPDRERMSPEHFGSTGRLDSSTRVFTAESETMIATLRGESRFIENTYEELGEEEAKELAYETFGTTPVGSANGTIWGVLTVDAPKTGDLDKERDMALMNIFAGLIAITYACECYGKPRR